MENNNGRRKFLKNTVKGVAVVTVSTAAAGSFLQSCSPSNTLSKSKAFTTGFDQTPLPYAYDALENIIDAKTMEIHYSKHAAAYSKALKEAATAEGVNTTEPLENVLAKISRYSVKMRNNAGGHYNHEMFWKSMQPKKAGNLPTGNLQLAIDKSFSSFANFKTQFGDAAKTRFGSGWAWLYIDAANTLKIGSTPNQDNPLMDNAGIKGFPILGLDVWEHAYYLKYQNKRADYIDNWWNLVNWNYAESRYNGK